MFLKNSSLEGKSNTFDKLHWLLQKCNNLSSSLNKILHLYLLKVALDITKVFEDVIYYSTALSMF